jgi:hypothetical protein
MGDDRFWRSSGISLLFAGAMVTASWIEGCGYDEIRPPQPTNSKILLPGQVKDDQDVDNNSYIPGYGYYHAIDHRWHPYPFNWYYPQYGYYYSGGWNDTPFRGSIPEKSRPSAGALAVEHRFARTGVRPEEWTGGGFRSSFERFSRGISRGGFGGAFHGIHG